jgi:opacity protein-like surface antigen
VKKIFIVLVISAGFFMFLPSRSFALVDASGYGGYMFNGTVEGNSDADPKGYNYGLKAHYNTSLFPMIELGIGAYYQNTKFKYDLTAIDEETLLRKSAGLDMNLIVNLPIIHPYGRLMYSFWDDLEGDVERFKAYGLGAGLEFTVFPFVRIFGEYIYEKTTHYDTDYKNNSVNLGIKIDI